MKKTFHKKFVDRKYRWHFNYLKQSEGVPYLGNVQKLFGSEQGIIGWTEPSAYVGHVCVIVCANTSPNMKKALRILKKNSYIENITEEYHDVEKCPPWYNCYSNNLG
jgi:hypothetical protein